MIKFFYSMFAKHKMNKIKRRIDSLYLESVNFQRNGKLREYAQTIDDINALEEQYARLQDS